MLYTFAGKNSALDEGWYGWCRIWG